MNPRKIHQWLGIVLLLPFVVWIVTGAVFLIKPGYGAAYEKIQLKTYPLTTGVKIPDGSLWHEARLLKTRLGDHLLVRDHGVWRHLSATTLEAFPEPDERQLILLLNEAIATNPQRYGIIKAYQEPYFITTTGVRLTLNWQTLSLRQRGPDTRLISTLYDVHALEWLPWPMANRVLGFAALVALLVLVGYGVVLYFAGRRRYE